MEALEKRKPFFSIIMPIYNAEKYLQKAVDSVLRQSYKDFELILVNDGSLDNSLDICKKNAVLDDRIVVLNLTENCGVASARNAGLKTIRGKYLNFVDADDYIDVDVLEEAYAAINRFFPQLLKYGCVEEYYDERNVQIGTKILSLPEKVFKDNVDIRLYILEMEKKPLFGYLCNSFYDVELLIKNKVVFDLSCKVNEDFMFNMALIEHVHCMVCINNTGYHYAKRIDNSLSTSANSKYLELHLLKINKLLEKYNEWGLLNLNVKQDIFWLYTRIVYSAICRTEAAGLDVDKVISSIVDDNLFAIYKNVKFTNATWKEKILIYLLQQGHMKAVKLICVLINIVKNNFQILFAKIKG